MRSRPPRRDPDRARRKTNCPPYPQAKNPRTGGPSVTHQTPCCGSTVLRQGKCAAVLACTPRGRDDLPIARATTLQHGLAVAEQVLPREGDP